MQFLIGPEHAETATSNANARIHDARRANWLASVLFITVAPPKLTLRIDILAGVHLVDLARAALSRAHRLPDPPGRSVFQFDEATCDRATPAQLAWFLIATATRAIASRISPSDNAV